MDTKNNKKKFAIKYNNEKRKNKLMVIGFVSIIFIVIGISIYNFINVEQSTDDIPSSAGKLGDEHVHASLLVRIFGDKFDFSLPAYQIKNSWIHFEARDGVTIHRHSTGIELGYLFESLGIMITDSCYIFPDQREFCTNDDYSLKFYINHKHVLGVSNYVINDGDRILISYGNENKSQINKQLSELDLQQIIK